MREAACSCPRLTRAEVYDDGSTLTLKPPRAASSKVQNQGYQWFHRMVIHLATAKKSFKKSNARYICEQYKKDPRIHYTQARESTGDGVSTLGLKPMGGVNQSPKQREPVAPQNGDLSPEKN